RHARARDLASEHVKSQRGQASIEWIALLLVVATVLAVGSVDAFGDIGWIPGKIRCAITGGSQGGDPSLKRAYTREVAAKVRAHAPIIVYEPGTHTLPVDFRACREHRCADGPDRPGEVHRSARGDHLATAFTRVIDRRAQGGPLYVQYWL